MEPDPMAELERATGAGRAADAPDPMAALEAAAALAQHDDRVGRRNGADDTASKPSADGADAAPKPFDFFDAFQRARPSQALPHIDAPHKRPSSSAVAADLAAKRRCPEQHKLPEQQGPAEPQEPVEQRIPVEPPAIVKHHESEDPLARLLIRQNRQVCPRCARVPSRSLPSCCVLNAMPCSRRCT